MGALQGGLFTFGHRYDRRRGHGGEDDELVLRLVEALGGGKVIAASAGGGYTAVRSEAGEPLLFGDGEGTLIQRYQ